MIPLITLSCVAKLSFLNKSNNTDRILPNPERKPFVLTGTISDFNSILDGYLLDSFGLLKLRERPLFFGARGVGGTWLGGNFLKHEIFSHP